MSIEVMLTNDTLSGFTWQSGNKSEPSAFTAETDGGSITRKLGGPTELAYATATYTSNGTTVSAHMGTWVTDPFPEDIEILSGSSFGFNHLCGWESAGQMNAYPIYKLSVVSEISAGMWDFDRPLTEFKTIQLAGVDREIGTTASSAYPMGAVNTNGGINTHNYVPSTSGTTILSGERLALEVGFRTVGRNNDTLNIEFGHHHNIWDDATLSTGTSGTGPYGSELLVPFQFSRDNADALGEHAEIQVPYVAGTDTIAWADIGTDYSAAKWEDTGAKRYVQRWGGSVNSQFWVFQDDDYLYFAINYIQDGCIQSSDHHRVFIDISDAWKTSLETTSGMYQFCRDITAGGSDTRNPTLPVAQGDGNDQGEYILRGDPTATYPEGWEIPTYTIATDTFTFTGGETWVDGVDWRFKGPGATSTAPNPAGSPGGAYSELKIKKSSLGWVGTTGAVGMGIITQCDVQGNGSTMFPTLMGNQVDKSDWPWLGIDYQPLVAKTASSKTTKDELDFRPIMVAHAHIDQALATVSLLPLFFGCNF